MTINTSPPGAYAKGELIHSSQAFPFGRPRIRPLTIPAASAEALPNAIARVESIITQQNHRAIATTTRLRLIGAFVLNPATGEYEPLNPVVTAITNGVYEVGRFIFEVSAGR